MNVFALSLWENFRWGFIYFDNLLAQLNKKFDRKILNIFLSNRFNICFGWSNEPSQWVPKTYALVEK